MVLNVYLNGEKNVANQEKKKNENETIEIQKIKNILNIECLKYVSDNVNYLLNLNFVNDLTYFNEKITNNLELYRVILYIRLSVEDGDLIDGDVSRSIRNQLLFLLDECKKREWIVVGIFCEEDISGILDNRPEWNKSLEFCECGNTEIFLCKSQSRFSRSMEDVEKYLHNKFVEWRIRFDSIVDNADTSNRSNKKSRQINALVNEWQVEDQSENIRAILKSKQSNGLFTGSFAPYGYMKDPKDKYHLVIDEDAAKVVRKIFEMYNSGDGVVKICNYLNKNKIPIPSIYKNMKGLKYHNSLIELEKRVEYRIEVNDTLKSVADQFKANTDEILEYNHLNIEDFTEGKVIIIPVRPIWRTTSIYNILKDEVYIGTLIQHKNEIISYKNKKERKIPDAERIKVPHCHIPIIDSETWNKTCEKYNSMKKMRPSKNGDIALFSGKIKCSGCGCYFYRNKAHVKAGDIYYLSCGNYYKTARYICNNTKSLKEHELADIILKEINNQINIYYDKKKIEDNFYKEKIENNLISEINCLNKEKSDIEINISKKENALALLYDDRASGIIDLNEFTVIKNKTSFDISNMKKRIKKIEDTIKEMNNKKSKEYNLEEVIKKYTKIENLNRYILDEFVDKIYVGYYDKKTKKRKITIKWNINVS